MSDIKISGSYDYDRKHYRAENTISGQLDPETKQQPLRPLWPCSLGAIAALLIGAQIIISAPNGVISFVGFIVSVYGLATLVKILKELGFMS